MRLEGNNLVCETETCCMCGNNGLPPGKAPGRKACPDCKGTRRGKRGGKDGCRTCYNGTVPDWDNPVDCGCCEGTGIVPETLTSYLTGDERRKIVSLIPLRLFFADRGMSFNESYIGIGTVYSVGDYGRTWEALSMGGLKAESFLERIREELAAGTSLQACKIADKEGNLCNHIAVIVNREGYSIWASYTDDSTDLLKQANGQPSVAAGILIGTRIYNEGGNGTLAAATGLF